MKKQAIEVIAQVLDIPPERLNEESSPETIEEWDSVKQMNIVLALEEAFGLTFKSRQVMRLHNLGDIFKALEELGAGT